MPTHRTEEMGWDVGVIYVIGHQRPDTDAIAAALGYAWYLGATGEERVVPARAGQLAAQTLFVLRRFGVSAPRLIGSMAPTFGHVARPQGAVGPEAPLAEALARLAGHTGSAQRVVPVLDA